MKKTSNMLILIGFVVLSILVLGFFVKMKSHLVSDDAKVTPISKEMHEKWADILGIEDLKIITKELDSLSANVLNLGGNSQYILDPNSTKIKVKAYSSLVSQIETMQTEETLSLGRLKIPASGNITKGFVSSPPDMAFTIGIQDKDSLVINAGTGIELLTSDKLDHGKMQLNLSRQTKTKLELDADNLVVNMNAESTCELSGTFEKLTINN